ncbi:Alkaline phosphatase [Saliniradius amylolyticus]|uniref:Alkaline phosphatase n=1 Tax=Saliniradius amylolyticus TaxID=2183582 RepID=A0A2S2E1R0_9ALTE|nr:alkaline phosphatase [Saliniradius amylolyticus]AWL11574.1 Alkaline phosphatase [Saliniradius amylolyticus]
MLKRFLFSALAAASVAQAEPAPNIILMIGDGMGVSHTTAYRYFADESRPARPTVLDEMLVGMSRNTPDDDYLITDSAAGATALSAGIKTYNGAIAVDNNKQPVPTVLELAKERGYQTGVISTVQVNHATPASFLAHNEARRNYHELADDYLDEKIKDQFKFDVLLGGGTDYFVRNDRDLTEEFKQAGGTYIDDWSELEKTNSLPLMGLFAPVNLPYVVDTDDKDVTRLATMVSKATDLLDDAGKPFFLMAEGGMIDWCSHDNDIACTMYEMTDFANGVQAAKDYVDAHPNTLLVITADHETGGLSVGGYHTKQWKPAIVKQVHRAIVTLADDILAAEPEQAPKLVAAAVDFELTDKEVKQLVRDRRTGSRDIIRQRLRDMINERTITGWTSLNHSAGDIQIFAYGQGAEAFRGSMENNVIGQKLIDLVTQD